MKLSCFFVPSNWNSVARKSRACTTIRAPLCAAKTAVPGATGRLRETCRALGRARQGPTRSRLEALGLTRGGSCRLAESKPDFVWQAEVGGRRAYTWRQRRRPARSAMAQRPSGVAQGRAKPSWAIIRHIGSAWSAVVQRSCFEKYCLYHGYMCGWRAAWKKGRWGCDEL